MRLLIAMMKHETNTFSPVPTPLARFGHGPGPLYGEAAIRAYRGTGTGLGAYLDLARREGAEIVLPVAAGAPPSGPVEDDAYAEITDRICAAAAEGGFDGIMLDLHGAMDTRSLEDGEGQLLKRLTRSYRKRRSRWRSTCTPIFTTRSSPTRRSLPATGPIRISIHTRPR